MKACVEKAVEFLGGAIHDAVEEGTDRNDGVCFEKYLGILTQNIKQEIIDTKCRIVK
mgnify:CR=1 FL=1